MKKKRGYIILLSFVVTATFAVVLFSRMISQEPPVTTSPSEENLISGKDSINSSNSSEESFCDEYRKWAWNVIGGATVQNYLCINSEYPHLELVLNNNSNFSVRVNLQDQSGEAYFVQDIDGGASLEWRSWENGLPDGMPSGGYWVVWSGGGHIVNGVFSGKTEAKINDFAK